MEIQLPESATTCYYTENKNGLVVLQAWAKKHGANKVELRAAYYVFYSEDMIAITPIAENDGPLLPEQIISEMLEKCNSISQFVVIGQSAGLIEDLAAVRKIEVRYVSSKRLLNYSCCLRVYEELFGEADEQALHAKYNFVMGNVEGIYV